jgi:hypothetical protein
MDWGGDIEPPSFSVYNMGSDFAPQEDNGAYIMDSSIVGIWQMNLRRSAFREHLASYDPA